ncbi:MAG: hypothetical protein IT264_01055 [Saprospiraceae bacterium]|nr:hypothetical protein [Saprospiraceae bacterium]
MQTTSVTDFEMKMNIRLFPNPSHDFIYFDPPIQNESCQIFSMDRKMISEMRIQQNYLNVYMLDVGIYYLDLKYSVIESDSLNSDVKNEVCIFRLFLLLKISL